MEKEMEEAAVKSDMRKTDRSFPENEHATEGSHFLVYSATQRDHIVFGVFRFLACKCYGGV
jgi:hypothetical protein